MGCRQGIHLLGAKQTETALIEANGGNFRLLRPYLLVGWLAVDKKKLGFEEKKKTGFKSKRKQRGRVWLDFGQGFDWYIPAPTRPGD